MNELPTFRVSPAFRCMHRYKPPTQRICGRPAVAFNACRVDTELEYRCAKHATPEDRPIPPGAVVRRVRVIVQADVAAVCWGASSAEAEAVERVRAALEAAGALVNLLEVTSTVGRTAGEPVPGALTAPGGGG
jgi:hypothetical protein